MQLSEMEVGTDDLGGGSGLAMNDTVPQLNLFDILDLYPDIIMANQNDRFVDTM